MTVKSIVDVAINADAWERFQAKYAEYTKNLGAAPQKWANVKKEVGGTSVAFESITKQLMQQSVMEAKSAEFDRQRTSSTRTNASLWASMTKSSASFAKNVVGATESLLKWTGILGAVGGLLGAGGLFGIDRLAANVSGERRSAGGLGLSIGQEKAFRLNFGRIVDPDAFLGWVNKMETDPSQVAPFYALTGHAPSQDSNKDSVEMLKAVRALAQRTPLNQLGAVMGAYGLQLSPEEQRRLHSGTDKEFNEQLAKYQKDAKSLDIPDDIAIKWQNLSNQLSRAESEIYKAFVVGLTPLAPALEKLSAAAVKFVETLLKSDLVKEGIDKLAGWLNSFSGELGGDEFLAKVKLFTSDIGDLGQAIHGLLHPWDTTVDAWDHAKTGLVNTGHSIVDYANSLGSPDGKGGTSQDDYTRRNLLNIMGKVGRDSGLPAGLLEAQAKLESDMNINVGKNPKSGATGLMQILPSTAKGLGIDPNNPFQSVVGAASLDMEALEKYHGDIDKALAAYDWGYGNSKDPRLDDAIAKYGKDWLSHAPKETQDYVGKGEYLIQSGRFDADLSRWTKQWGKGATKDSQSGGNTPTVAQPSSKPTAMNVQPPGITLRILNQTGGSAIIAASQLGSFA